MYEHTSLRKPIAVGTRFGRLKTTAPVDYSDHKHGGFVSCICDCGGMKERVRTASLRNGRCQSCGCLRRESAQRAASARNKGVNGTRSTDNWASYLQREHCDLCLEPLKIPADGRRAGHLEHAHSCEHSSRTIACKNCIRGVVCARCNRDISAFDRWGWPVATFWYKNRRPLLAN
jgi:hypothetical protein